MTAAEGRAPGSQASVGLVLVHGGYHGAWAWERLMPLLDRPALAIDLPGRGSRPAPLDEVTIDAAADSAVADIDATGMDRVMVVGHSLGGATIPAIAGRLGERATHLVFVSAFVVPDGQSSLDSLPAAERAAADKRLRTGPGQRSELSRESHREILCNDMDDATAESVLDRVGPDSMHFFTDRVSWAGVSPETKRVFVRLDQDRALPPDAQDQMIGRLGEDLNVFSIDSGHEVMITRPGALADILNKL